MSNADVKSVTITCPVVGQKALGGGALVVAGTTTPAQLQDVALAGSYPNATYTAWNAVAWETDSVGQTWSVTVYVLCATVA